MFFLQPICFHFNWHKYTQRGSVQLLFSGPSLLSLITMIAFSFEDDPPTWEQHTNIHPKLDRFLHRSIEKKRLGAEQSLIDLVHQFWRSFNDNG